MRQLLDAPRVAKILLRSVEWFHKNRARLEDEHGFPASVAGLGHRWDSKAIEHWLDRQLPPAQVPEADLAQVLVERARARLAH